MGTSERKTSCHPLTLSRNGTPDWEFQLGPARFQIRPARFQIGKIPDRAATCICMSVKEGVCALDTCMCYATSNINLAILKDFLFVHTNTHLYMWITFEAPETLHTHQLQTNHLWNKWL